jgi:hypothetical protein
MGNNKRITFYSIYTESNDDLQLVSQFDTLDEIAEHLKINKHVLSQMIYKKQLIKNQYRIIKDYIMSQELESI